MASRAKLASTLHGAQAGQHNTRTGGGVVHHHSIAAAIALHCIPCNNDISYWGCRCMLVLWRAKHHPAPPE